ncbi:MAG: MgtC/SapB family protein, partial [Candidatus Omnitrophota bacterium]
VVTGIGFLGAGAIIRYGASIRGLTTAASIWAVAAVGLAVGCGMYEAAGITTGVALVILILSRLEDLLEMKRPGKRMEVFQRAGGETCKVDIKSLIEEYGGRVRQITVEDGTGGRKKIILDIKLSRLYYKDIIAEISAMPGVEKVEVQ